MPRPDFKLGYEDAVGHFYCSQACSDRYFNEKSKCDRLGHTDRPTSCCECGSAMFELQTCEHVERMLAYMTEIWGEEELNQLCSLFNGVIVTEMFTQLAHVGRSPRKAALFALGTLIENNRVLMESIPTPKTLH